MCFDGDAGGGRFVATFAFLNRKERSTVLHHILLFEGSDCQANLEMTLGKFIESVRQMEGKSVVFNNVEIKIKLYGLFDLAALNKIVGKQSADIAVDHCVIVLLGQIFGPGIDYT